jgi:hypothetical protein
MSILVRRDIKIDEKAFKLLEKWKLESILLVQFLFKQDDNLVFQIIDKNGKWTGRNFKIQLDDDDYPVAMEAGIPDEDDCASFGEWIAFDISRHHNLYKIKDNEDEDEDGDEDDEENDDKESESNKRKRSRSNDKVAEPVDFTGIVAMEILRQLTEKAKELKSGESIGYNGNKENIIKWLVDNKKVKEGQLTVCGNKTAIGFSV